MIFRMMSQQPGVFYSTVQGNQAANWFMNMTAMPDCSAARNNSCKYTIEGVCLLHCITRDNEGENALQIAVPSWESQLGTMHLKVEPKLHGAESVLLSLYSDTLTTNSSLHPKAQHVPSWYMYHQLGGFTRKTCPNQPILYPFIASE